MRPPFWNNTATGEAHWSWSLRRRLPRKIRLALFFGVLACVTIASLVPDARLMMALGVNDKVLHAGGYAAVAAFTILIFERAFFSAATVLAFSGGIELAQSLVPWRDGSWGDLAANGVGIALALGVMGSMEARRPVRNE